jgi:hypothetical protein
MRPRLLNLNQKRCQKMVIILKSVKIWLSCYEFKLRNDFVGSLVTRGLSPLPMCVLDSEQLIQLINFLLLGGKPCPFTR